MAAEARHISSGNVLCLAEGEGRNAVYLAKLGYKVTAVDQSSAGLQKAKKLCVQEGVFIETIEADLADFEIRPCCWNGIISISAHLPPIVREKFHKQVVLGLKPGGVLILEAFTQKQLEIGGLGGPPPEQKDLFMSLQTLKIELAGLNFRLAREIERVIDEGRFHKGLSAVVQIVAEKERL